MKTSTFRITICVLSLILCFTASAQHKTIDSEMKAVLEQDSLMWAYFNACTIDKMRSLFTDDTEFYHDKSGILKGVDNFIATSHKNLCSTENFRLRRDVVPGTLNVFPLQNNGIVYGAILTGEHVFYVIEKAKEPRLDGHARFTHLFLKTDSGWRMSRVFSYDHGPAQYINKRKEVTLSQRTLLKYAGTYIAPHAGLCVVKANGNILDLVIGDQSYKLYPESESNFFVPDRDLTFEFHENKMIVRENGNVVEEAVRKPSK
jgi:hypothetical protein